MPFAMASTRHPSDRNRAANGSRKARVVIETVQTYRIPGRLARSPPLATVGEPAGGADTYRPNAFRNPSRQRSFSPGVPMEMRMNSGSW